MALVTAAQFDITPNALGAIASGQQYRANEQAMDINEQNALLAKQKASQQQEIDALARVAVGGQGQGQQNTNKALIEILARDPARFEQITQGLGLISDQQKQEAGDFAFTLQNTPYEQRQGLIEQRAQQLQAQGRNPKDTLELLNLDEASQNAALKTVEIATLPADKRIELMQGPELTSLQKNIVGAGFEPGTVEFQNEILRNLRKPTATTVNVSTGKGLAKEQEELGKLRAQDLAGIRARADEATSTISSLDILENIDVETGSLEPAKQAVASVAESFGINADGLANISAGEAFNAESKKLVLKIMATQKGPQTDTDRREIEKTIANLKNTKAGNQFIINSTRALAERAMEQRDFYNNYLDENETTKGANKAWNDFKRNTPLVSRNLRTPEGLPVFYYKFSKDVRAANPNASEQEILQAWRDQDKRSK